MTMKKVLTIALTLTLTITGTLTVAAQTGRQLKVYMKGGLVDKVQVATNASIGHSRTDLNGTVHDDYVSAVVKDAEGRERQYLISQLDSLVMPNGRRVVFIGNQNGNVNGNENQNENQNQNENGSRSTQRRTIFKGRFPGTAGSGNVTFYWQPNDRIRLDAGYASRAEQLTGGGTGASFYFDGADDLDATSYRVYFPDRSVTIKSVQTQIGADNTDHIGQSGDCGTATATRTPITQHPSPNTTYTFTLDHKAAYLCFLPHIDNLPSAKLTKITLSCSAAIAGTYELSGSGLYNGTATSSTITLNLVPQKAKDFFIGHDALTEQDSCAAYMVIAPQSSNQTFTVTYHLTDTLSRLKTFYIQSLSNFKPVANTVYPVTCRIPDNIFQSIDLGFDHLWSSVNLGSMMPDEPGNYYAWGETAPKGEFTVSNYTADVDSEVLDICGTEYDPVSQSPLGNSWQMPTAAEMEELIDLCQWEWSVYNGAEGWLVTGTNNGNDDVEPQRIFLPMTGYKNGIVTQQPSQGYYWLGTREDGASGNASALILSRESKQKALMQGWQGMNIRPVKTIWREFNIPYSGLQYIDLRSHGPGYNIKVYDHAGPNGNYGNSVNGYIQITCAEGYKLNITGNVDTEGCDYFRCYDVTENGDVQFAVASGWGGSINATSKTNVVKLYFKSDGSIVGSGLNLTVTIQRMTTVYHVNVEDVEGGTLSINHSTINAQHSTANPEDTITMTATPAPGYVLHHIEVKCDGEVLTLYEDDPRLFQSASSAARHYLMCDTVRVRDGNWWHDTSHFLMPYSDVTVTPVFTNSDEDLWLNMAGNGTTKVERKYLQRLIDNGMSKFRFYDYAGKNGNYGNNVDGYMFVDAPAGYVMQIDASTVLEGADHLYIYDGSNNSYQCLMDPHGTGSTTTHNNAFFAHFHTDGSVVYSGYDCVVTLKPDEVVQFNIPYNTVVDLTEEHMTWLLNTKGLTTMKVYDSGGPDGNYGNSASGSLYFHLPQGYHMHVYGTSTTEHCDHLYVYDTDGVKVNVAGQNQTVDFSTKSNFLRLQLTSDGSTTYSGVDLTVDFIQDEE